MERSLYDVCYVDKFHNHPNANILRERIAHRFRLTEQALAHLSTGEPVVVKKKVELGEAKRYVAAFRAVGGVCWIQPQAMDGRYRERRHQWRRSLLDRRAKYRASSVQPDRRQSCGRRSTDMWRPQLDEF